MTLIRCIPGAFQVPVMGTTYSFEFDAGGRAVAEVPIDRHVELLLSAGTYEIVEPLPIAALLEQKGPDLDAIRAELLTAVAPSFMNVAADGEPPVIVAEAPWPELAPLPIDDLVEAGVPDFITIDPNDRLIIRVSNGEASYDLKGVADGVRLYALLDGSTYEPWRSQAGDDAGEQDTEEQTEPATTPTESTATTETATTPPAPRKPDELIAIVGVGKAMVAKLAALGVTTFAQIAAWTAEDVAKFDATLKTRGGITRDRWVEQAAELAKAAS